MRDKATGGTDRPFVVSGAGQLPRPVAAANTAVIAAPFGCLTLSAFGEVLDAIDISLEPIPTRIPAQPLLESAARQFERYFDDPAFPFSLPLRLGGTNYARRVWNALAAIPPGQVETYGSLARQLGSGPRAVAGGCRANPFPIIIPCHRVVSAHGLGGYSGKLSGPWLDIKRWLLRHEGYALA
jgi:methylated-DNA-[protein]-cysteine S-methyltransferase